MNKEAAVIMALVASVIDLLVILGVLDPVLKGPVETVVESLIVVVSTLGLAGLVTRSHVYSEKTVGKIRRRSSDLHA